MKLLLELRNKLKAKKPVFSRQDSHKKKRVGTAWRRPKGHQNKMRLHLKGYSRVVATGFGSPKAVYGLSKDGLNQVIVTKVSDLDSLNPKSDGLIISRTLGDRKRSLIVKEASAKGFKILNFKVEDFNKKLESKLEENKTRKKVLESRRKEKKAKLKDSKKDNNKESKSVSSDSEKESKDKKIEEKKEHDKILTKKGGEL